MKIPKWVWIVSAVVPVSFFLLPQKSSPGVYSFGDPTNPYRDPGRLIPAFADRVELLFQRLRARGFQPFLVQGYRTPEQAADNEARGTGIARSQHILGAAADIHDAGKSAAFPRAVGEEAKRLGLTWGGDFSTRYDWAHVQAAPGKLDGKMWAMSSDQRARFVKELLG